MAAEAEAKQRGADEAVFVDADGVVLEGTVTNVWWRSGRDAAHALARPRDPRRRHPPDAARARRRPCGYRVEEGAFPLGDLADADEAFTSSSVREIMPVVELDGHLFDRGAAADACSQQALRERARLRSERWSARTVRLGGMALQNGVLVHGPTSWGCAVRDEDGSLHVASGRKPRFAESVLDPVPPRPAPAGRGVRASSRSCAERSRRPASLRPPRGARCARRDHRSDGRAPPALGRAVERAAASSSAGALALLPAALALRGPGLAEYHGAEHVSIGTYENGGEPAPKEHPRCGSQLIAPLLASSLAANVAASKVPAPARGRRPAARDDRRRSARRSRSSPG